MIEGHLSNILYNVLPDLLEINYALDTVSWLKFVYVCLCQLNTVFFLLCMLCMCFESACFIRVFVPVHERYYFAFIGGFLIG